MGSPPHTWRKHGLCSVSVHEFRITSTYVEKTRMCHLTKRRHQDHLHIRGENSTGQQAGFGYQGSPPHTWRKPMLSEFRSCLSQDHLHIRGENLSALEFWLHRSGSPPHTWRKRQSIYAGMIFLRITSTYVEKTSYIFVWINPFQDHLHIRGENSII